MSALNRLQQSVERIDLWIAENKPSPAKSQEVFMAFMARYGSAITGSDAFVAKTTRVIEKASRLAAGVTIMQRLLATGHDMIIKEDTMKTGYHRDSSSLAFNFCNPKGWYVYLNKEGKRDFYRYPNTPTFIHECLHAWHDFVDASAMTARTEQSGHLVEMESAEEELTIAGHLHLNEATDADFCCENTALRELNYPLRINHRGTDDANPDLHELVQNRVFCKIRELCESGEIQSYTYNKLNIHPLEFAMHQHLLEDRSEVLQEWMQIIRMLIQAGCQSEYALKIAILQNSEELIELLLNAGVKLTDELLNYAIQKSDERFKLIWKMLEKQNCVNVIPSMLPNNHPFKDQSLKVIRQKLTVQTKFIDDGSLPIHTLETLFYIKKLKTTRDFFIDWTRSHSYSPIRLKEEDAEPKDNENELRSVFDCTPDGSCINSQTVYSLYAICNKVLPNSELSKKDLYFTPIEVENFIKAIKSKAIRDMAKSLSDMTISRLNFKKTSESSKTLPDGPIPITFHRTSRNSKLYKILRHFIIAQITEALSSSATSKTLSLSDRYLDISILSENNQDLFQEIKKDSDICEELKRRGKPVSSIVCRLKLEEKLINPTCYLYFHSQIFFNDKLVTGMTFFDRY